MPLSFMEHANRIVDEPVHMTKKFKKDVNMMNFEDAPLTDDERRALLAEEDRLTTLLADPKLTSSQRYKIQLELDANYLKQRDEFYTRIHPRNSVELRAKYARREDEGQTEYLRRQAQHPVFGKIFLPLFLVSVPAFFRFYPQWAAWRHVNVRQFSKGQLRRRRTIWRRSVLAEDAPKAIVERVAGRVLVGVSVALFFMRITDEYLAIVHGKAPYMTADFESE